MMRLLLNFYIALSVLLKTFKLVNKPDPGRSALRARRPVALTLFAVLGTATIFGPNSAAAAGACPSLPGVPRTGGIYEQVVPNGPFGCSNESLAWVASQERAVMQFGSTLSDAILFVGHRKSTAGGRFVAADVVTGSCPVFHSNTRTFRQYP